jgi:hypothetical protein
MSTTYNQINLGDEVKDELSGFKGIACARVEWLNGTMRIVVQGPVDKDGKLSDAQSFDELNLEVTQRGKVKPRAISVSGQQHAASTQQQEHRKAA